MRAIVSMAGAAIVVVLAGTLPASAERYYPWCYNEASLDGGFSTWEQCMANRHGNAGFCARNPWYAALGAGDLEAAPRKPGRRAR